MEKIKLYCYVDENGQDTLGRIFVVSVVAIEKQRDELLAVCEQLEQVSEKRKDKWGAAKHDRRMKYLRCIFADERFKGSLRYEVFYNTRDYDTSTITAIASAVKWNEITDKYVAFIYVDGLTKTKRREYGARLRHLGLMVHQVQGIAKDETNALTRLADAIAGFVRDAIDSQSEEIKELFQKAKRDGVIVEIKQ